jgi:ABC-2 type transport system ATP-binding protein
MAAITLQNLSKNYQVEIKQPGLKSTLRSLFHRQYKTIPAVHNISFQVQPGEIVGFLGPNGAGKTTTLKMCSGLLYPSSGTVEVLGHTPFNREPAFLKQISLVMGQKNQLWWDLPAIETFRLNQAIYEIPNSQYQQTLQNLTEMLEVQDIIHQQVRKLSLGQRMKCELIAALLHNPKVLFLDEPTIGLDVMMQKKVRQFLKEYNQKYGATIILTSHYMQDVKEVCSRVILIDQGHQKFDGTISELHQKYAPYKIILLRFAQNPPPPNELQSFGKISIQSDNSVTLQVSPAKVTTTTTHLLQNYQIADLEITEPRLEDIVTSAFQQSISSNNQ